MNTSKKVLLPAIFLTIGAVYAAPAQAAPEYVLILLDQTGSMCNDSDPCAPTTGNFWSSAIDDAKNWVADDQNNTANPISSTQRFYSVWTFKNTQNGAQSNAVQLWPTATFNTGCNSTHATIDGPSGFCKFTINDRRPYDDLQTAVLDPLKTASGQVPLATWLTPLADSLCRSLSAVWASVTGQKRTLILESDGGENASALACLGAGSTTAINSAADIQTAKAKGAQDFGFTVGSWQAKVMRRGVRLTSFDSPPFDGAEASAVATPLLSTDTLPTGPTGLTMKVGVHYALCGAPDANGNPDPACLSSASPLVARTAPLVALSSGGLKLDGRTGSQAAPMALAALAASAVTTAATSTQTPSIGAAELGFFRALGQITPNGKLHEVVRDPTVVYGVNHKLAGDVDDSGCTDRADYNIVTQKDVWMQRAVRPCEICQRADLNRDGWVNEHDRDIVLANWGKGCINNPGPKPTP
jgi:hypothetical protein